MRKLTTFVAAIAAIFGIVILSGIASGDPVNPSFETGNTNGWEEDLAGGEIDVVEECDEDCPSPFAPYSPVHGRNFALLETGDEGDFVSLRQTLIVPGGSTVSAWVFFCNGEVDDEIGDCGTSEEEPNPGAASRSGEVTAQQLYCDEVRVAYQVGEAPNPFIEAFGVNACDDLSTDWTLVEFTVDGAPCQPFAVSFVAGISNVGDAGYPSRLGLDNVRVDDSHCVTQRPNIGAGLSGLFQGQPTPLPTAPSAVAPAATAPTISPPRTGDAGLADESSAPLYGVVAAGFVLTVVSVHRLVRR